MSKTISDAALRRQHLGDRLFRGTTRLFAFFVFAILVGIIISLLMGAWPALQSFGLKFFYSAEWNPVTDEYGALVPIYGTLATSAIALLIGVPVSFGIALFLTELSPKWLRRPLGIAIELLAGIPSIIYGMWGLFVFAPVFQEHVQPWLIDHRGNKRDDHDGEDDAGSQNADANRSARTTELRRAWPTCRGSWRRIRDRSCHEFPSRWRGKGRPKARTTSRREFSSATMETPPSMSAHRTLGKSIIEA